MMPLVLFAKFCWFGGAASGDIRAGSEAGIFEVDCLDPWMGVRWWINSVLIWLSSNFLVQGASSLPREPPGWGHFKPVHGFGWLRMASQWCELTPDAAETTRESLWLWPGWPYWLSCCKWNGWTKQRKQRATHHRSVEQLGHFASLRIQIAEDCLSNYFAWLVSFWGLSYVSRLWIEQKVLLRCRCR